MYPPFIVHTHAPFFCSETNATQLPTNTRQQTADDLIFVTDYFWETTLGSPIWERSLCIVLSRFSFFQRYNKQLLSALITLYTTALENAQSGTFPVEVIFLQGEHLWHNPVLCPCSILGHPFHQYNTAYLKIWGRLSVCLSLFKKASVKFILAFFGLQFFLTRFNAMINVHTWFDHLQHGSSICNVWCWWNLLKNSLMTFCYLT